MKKNLFLFLLLFLTLNVNAKEFKVERCGETLYFELLTIDNNIYIDIKSNNLTNHSIIYFWLDEYIGLKQKYISCNCSENCIVKYDDNIPIYRFFINKVYFKDILYKCISVSIGNKWKIIPRRNIGYFKNFLFNYIITEYDIKYNDLTFEYYTLQTERDSLLTDKLKLTDINLILENKVKLLTEEQNKKENEVNEKNVPSTNIQKYDSKDYDGLTYNIEKKTWVGKKYSRVKEPEKVYNTSGKYKYKYKYWRNGRWNYRY